MFNRYGTMILDGRVNPRKQRALNLKLLCFMLELDKYHLLNE